MGLVACKSSAPPPTVGVGDAPVNAPPPPTASGPVAPGVAATAIVPAGSGAAAGGRAIPALEQACQRDEECGIVNEDLTGATACCPGCAWHAGTKTSIKNFHTACKASPAPECPAIGCAMAVTEPRCVSGTCQAVVVKR